MASHEDLKPIFEAILGRDISNEEPHEATKEVRLKLEKMMGRKIHEHEEPMEAIAELIRVKVMDKQ